MPARLYLGQTYELVCRRPYTRRDGSRTELVVYHSACAQCGEAIEVIVPAGARKFSPNRRCQKHKRPGVRVKQAASG